MRKIAALILAISTFAAQLHAQAKDVTGIWEGNLKISIEIRIVFHFDKNGDGTYTGTMDSPDQGAKGIPLDKVAVQGDSVLVEFTRASVVYRGAVVNDSVISGVWQQRTNMLPLVMKRMQKETPPVVRPQTPVPPFSYNSEDVEYDNADRSIHFGATLTFPKTGGPFPTAILITGSGQQDRDETILGHKPFAVLADYLTKKGYAVLRVDDRMVGKTTGTLLTATSADFAKDIETGLDYALTRKEVDKNKIGLIGHSEGAMIAPMVAAERREINFIVLWGAGTVGGLRINVEQNGYALLKAGINPTAVNAFKQLHAKELALFGSSPDVAALNKRVLEVFAEWKQQQPDSILNSLYVSDSSVVGQSIYKIYDGLYNLAWMRFFIMHDFAADLAKVHCKVLAVTGELDKQVDAKTNLPVIDSVLKKNNNHSYKIVELKGLNHLFQTAVTGDVSEYSTIQETIAPLALETIGGWLDDNVMKK